MTADAAPDAGPDAGPHAGLLAGLLEQATWHLAPCDQTGRLTWRGPDPRCGPGCRAVLVVDADHDAQVRADAEKQAAERALAPVLALWAPRETGPMIGFQGCTDQDPNHCACATATDIECEACGEIIEPGEETTTYCPPDFPFLADDDVAQSWTPRHWHTRCDLRAAATDGAQGDDR